MSHACELVNCVTVDGVRLHGAWTSGAGQGPLNGWTIVTLHGVGGNFYSSNLFQRVKPQLLDLGASILWTNNRGHDGLSNSVVGPKPGLGAAFELVDECRLDVQAWLEWVRHHVAVSRVVLWGHSLGAIKALYSMAHLADATVKGIIASSPPILSSQRFSAGKRSEEYQQNIQLAQSSVDAGREWDLIRVRYPFPLWIAAKAYLDKYGPGERYNILRFATQVQRSTLFTYGALELRQGSESFADVESSICGLPGADQWFRFCEIPRANHFYTDGFDSLGEEIESWLMELQESDRSD